MMTSLDRLAITVCLFALLYFTWIQKGEIQLLNDDVSTLRAQIGDLSKRPTTTQRAKPKPKPRPPGTATA